jgi:hypothetical protein
MAVVAAVMPAVMPTHKLRLGRLRRVQAVIECRGLRRSSKTDRRGGHRRTNYRSFHQGLLSVHSG